MLKRLKRVAFLSSALTVAGLPLSGVAIWSLGAAATEKVTLHLVYTSDTVGYIDPCG